LPCCTSASHTTTFPSALSVCTTDAVGKLAPQIDSSAVAVVMLSAGRSPSIDTLPTTLPPALDVVTLSRYGMVVR
jgi:hypothetical protein